MGKRITEQMVKAKNPNYEKMYSIINDWLVRVGQVDGELLYKNTILQLAGALYLDNIDDKIGIDIINTMIDRMMLCIFTPKAWSYVKEMFIQEINENYSIRTIKKWRKKNGDFTKESEVRVG